MDWIVTTARTVEEAQTRALDLLGVDVADAEIQVIEEGKTGLFGRTKSEARVRARIKPKAPPAKDDRRPSRNDSRGGGGRNRGSKDGGSRDGGSRDGGSRDGGSKGQRQGGSSRNGGGRSKPDRDQQAGASKKDQDGGDRGRNRNDRADRSARADSADGGDRGQRNDRGDGAQSGSGGGGRSRSRGGSARSEGRGRDRSGPGRDGEDRVEMPVAEQRETLEEFVTGVAQAFDSDAKVELVEEGTTLQAQVTGTELGRLIGNKASTLQALEELARTAMHRAAAGRRYHRIQVDVDNYRGRRREALVRFATDLAEDVARTGKSKAMEPMGAADRKLVHDAVSEITGVETVSEGRDPRRYIVILATDRTDEEE